MHPDPAFRIDDPELDRMLIDAIGFGMVIAATSQGLRVAHTPIVGAGAAAVRFHLGNGNALTGHLDGAEALVLINGPDAYVSPRWYEDRGQVPTWNYVALELEGIVRRLADEELADLLGEIGARQERGLAGEPWRPDHVPAARWSALFEGITGFELEVRARRATWKLSQNKSAEDRARVADALQEEASADIAQLMRGVDTPPPGA